MKSYKLILGSLCLFFLTAGCTQSDEKTSRVETLPYFNEATFTPQWLENDDYRIAELHQIPDFELLNQNNEIVTQATFENKIYVTDFFFTSCPGICPKMTKNMGVIQEAFKDDDDVLLLSHSVTPEQDTPEILQEYAYAKGVIVGKWQLVTGSRDEIYDLGRNQYFVEENLGLEKSNEEFLHTENFILVDQNKHIRGIYNGLNKTSIQQLIADIKTLKLQ